MTHSVATIRRVPREQSKRFVGGAALLGRVMLDTWRWAAATAGAIAVFMVLTFPFVDFLTECSVGVPVIDWGIQRC